jgi:hypothetical protein
MDGRGHRAYRHLCLAYRVCIHISSTRPAGLQGSSPASSFVAIINGTGSIILKYVDDFVMITPTKAEMAALKAQLCNKFKCSNLGPIAHCLSKRIGRDRNRRTMELPMGS